MTTKANAIQALTEVAETMALTQRELGNDIADMASAVVENTKATEQVSNLLVEAVSRLGATIDKLVELEGRLGRYLTTAEKQESGIRQVDARLRNLETKLGQ